MPSSEAKQHKCRGPQNGWELCPWCMTCGMADPFYLLNRKLQAAGQTDAAQALGLELAEFMMLLDKLFLTEKREAADRLLPGFELWIKDLQKQWTAEEDCYCRQAPSVTPLNDKERERLSVLWQKSRTLVEVAKEASFEAAPQKSV